jgi:GAF domain-containing protein
MMLIDPTSQGSGCSSPTTGWWKAAEHALHNPTSWRGERDGLQALVPEGDSLMGETGDSMDPRSLTPVSETREAFDWLGTSGDDDLEGSIMAMSRRVREIAPECVAMSLSVAEGDLTFTVVSNRPGALLLDAVQYLGGGPCLEAITQREVKHTSELPVDEGRWQLFARAEALTGISSSLSLPILGGEKVVGGVNLYGATPNAFDGHHQELAAACGAWAEGAVTNADLEFNSRVRAAATPARLFDRGVVDLARGLLSDLSSVALDEAESRLREAAARAGVSEIELAQFLLQSHADEVDQQSRATDASD